jgi:positive regulator of sigma E activity
MLMEVIGKVIKTDGTLATVFIENCQSCDSCELAKFCLADKNGREIVCINNKGAKVGDVVQLDTTRRNLVIATSLNFILPLLFLIGGVLIGKKIWQTDLAGFISGISLMILYFFWILFVDRKGLKESRLLPEIISIKK